MKFVPIFYAQLIRTPIKYFSIKPSFCYNLHPKYNRFIQVFMEIYFIHLYLYTSFTFNFSRKPNP